MLVSINSNHPELGPRLLRALPYAMVGLVLLKLAAGSWALDRCRRRHLIQTGTMVKIGLAWLLAAFGSWALLCLLLDAGLRSAMEMLTGILLFLPLARPALAPLAMDWNRHR